MFEVLHHVSVQMMVGQAFQVGGQNQAVGIKFHAAKIRKNPQVKTLLKLSYGNGNVRKRQNGKFFLYFCRRVFYRVKDE